jgi:hypothetical protein
MRLRKRFWIPGQTCGLPGMTSTGSRSSLGLPFEFVLAFFERGEGLAPFLRSRTLGRRLSDSAAAEPMSAKRETGATRDPEEKTGRSIRCPARIRPLHQARSGVELKPSGRAPALHAFKSISRPLPSKLVPSTLRPCEADAAAFRRVCNNTFHPARGLPSHDPEYL